MAKNLSSHGEGHNSGMIDRGALRGLVERLKSLREERKALNEDFKELYAELKEAGFVPKHIRDFVNEITMDQEVLEDKRNYMASLHHAWSDTPLGNTAKPGLRRPDGQTDLEDAIKGAA